MPSKIFFAVLMLTGASVASAVTPGPCIPDGGPPATAPELDPSSGMTGLILLAGGLAVLRGRIKRKTEA